VIRLTVKGGDTLYSIARRFGVTVASLLGANGMDDPSKIRAGAELLVPGGQQTGDASLAVDRTTLRLKAEKYRLEESVKDLIVLHFTAGQSARSAYNGWAQSPGKVATPYLVDADGRIYECFEPRFWAYHLGLQGAASEGYYHDRRSIPIEIANVGSLKPDPANPNQLNWWPPADPRTGLATYRTKWCTLDETGRYVKSSYRGFDYFAAFPEAQLASVGALVRHLCSRFSIPLQPPPPERRAAFDLAFYREWKGIASHQNFRIDKSDIGPSFDWDKLNA
jgi:N-acetyl-anhydromuramyl-L-alanine amidase AmpD